MNDHSPRGNSFRAALLRGERPQLLIDEKQPRLERDQESLGGEIVPRAEFRRGDHRDGDRHRLSEEGAAVRYGGKSHPVELVNLSSGGAMVRAQLAPQLWELVELELGEGHVIECAVRWLRDDLIGLEFAHETKLDCDPKQRAELLLEVIRRSFPDVQIQLEDPDAPADLPSPAEEDLGNRAEVRHPLIWKGELHYGAHSQTVRLRNISSGGALLDVAGCCPTGLEVVLELGNAGSIQAVVSWSHGDQVGLRFAEPFDMGCLARSRPEVAPQHWVKPSFLDQVPDEGSPWNEQWSRSSLTELHADLEGFLKR